MVLLVLNQMTAIVKDALVELYDCYHALHGGTDWVNDIPSFSDVGDVECDDEIGGSKFDLSVGFSKTAEMQDTIGGKNELERFLLKPVERKRPSFDVLTW
ncbi:hypothetical protein ACOSP7_013768 [Xanthoceras sorbifolium]